ncbi:MULTISPECIES: Mor transcription activator family protein [unclassified Neisseria]|uniref:Mor transcription activator family protein n=2 Tax=Neisseria TaxID=482 RepID=UPI00266712F4|nr:MULTISPECIES: Mor transcription activator family protein [unclassified Neisseria]MDO1510394.1 Mor transcription activator family protein [Neisseria sp. MVDL19-042950]MDO1563644.1 Mor transcription activator family protein [Neisseria sp. MVDL20-010259]
MNLQDIKITSENLPLVIDIMPDKFHELKTVVGEEAALNLFQKHGGANMPIGLNKTKNGKKLYAELVESIGNKAAEKFTEAFAARSRSFYVSNCLKAKIRLRNMVIKKDFDEITNGGITSPRAVNDLAVKYGLSARAIWFILKT